MATDQAKAPQHGTLSAPAQAELRAKLQAVFASGRLEFFEDGMDTQFSRGLVSSIEEYGAPAVEMVHDRIVHDKLNAEVASEALRWVGDIDQPHTHEARRRLLEDALGCSAARVRDGAGIGLASMDDPRALPALREAIEREQCDELSDALKQVLDQLEKTSQCPSS